MFNVKLVYKLCVLLHLVQQRQLVAGWPVTAQSLGTHCTITAQCTKCSTRVSYCRNLSTN